MPSFMVYGAFMILLTVNVLSTEHIDCDYEQDCGCNGEGYCELGCVGWSQCKGSNLDCNYGYPCHVHCGNSTRPIDDYTESCKSAIINSNNATNLTVECTETGDCMNIEINCYNSDLCHVICQTPNTNIPTSKLCKNLSLNCGTSNCKITCGDDDSSCDQIQVDISNAISFECIGSEEACYNAPDPFVLSTNVPTTNPSLSPTYSPSITPSISPSKDPSLSPTDIPTKIPTITPSTSPTKDPTLSPLDNALITNWEQSTFGRMESSDVVSDACIVSVKHENLEYPKIYVFGGRNDENVVQNTILKWDPNESDGFVSLSAILPWPMVCESQRLVYHENTREIYGIGPYMFNPEWDNFEPSPISSKPLNVSNSCVVVDDVNNLMYVIGGFDEKKRATNNIQIFNLMLYQWTFVPNNGAITQNLASCSCWLSLNGSQLYTFGGITDSQSLLDDIYRFVFVVLCNL